MTSSKTEIASVPAHPVALIEVAPETGSVLVNGVSVEIPEGTNLHVAGVHAAARRVAQVLGRPVRALAKDPSGQTFLVINPDGSVSHIEPPAVTTSAPAPTPAAAASADVGRGAMEARGDLVGVTGAAVGLTSVPAVVEVEHQVEHPVVEQHLGQEPAIEEDLEGAGGGLVVDPPADAAVRRGTSRRRRRPRALLVASGAALVLVAGGGLALVTTGEDSGDGDGAGGAVAASEGAETDLPAEVLANPFELIVGEELEVQPVLGVRAVGGLERVRLFVTSSEVPAKVRVELRRVGVASGDGPAPRTVRITDPAQLVVLDDLDAGAYQWRVTTPDAKPATGRVRVTAPVQVTPPTPTTEESTSSTGEVPDTSTDTPDTSPVTSPDTGGGGGGNGGGGSGSGGGGNEPDSPVGSGNNNDPTSPVPHRLTAEPTYDTQTNEPEEQREWTR